MISKRKLMNWRREALINKQMIQALPQERFSPLSPALTANDRILALTQELIDQHLMRETQANDKTRKQGMSKVHAKAYGQTTDEEPEMGFKP